MHICFLTNEYPKIDVPHGGIGTFVQTTARQLVKMGHQVSIIGTNDIQKEEFEEDLGVFVYRTKRFYLKGVKAVLNFLAINKKLKEIHLRSPINVVESNEAGLALLSKIKGVEYVIRMHGGHHFFTKFENRPREKKKVWLERRSFKKADHLVAVSKYVAKVTLEELRLTGKDVTVIYNSVNTQKFNQVDYTKAKANSLLFIGSVCEKKGIRQLVQALSIVKKKIPQVTLEIIGRDWFFPDGSSYVEYLKSFISQDIADAVKITGAVPNTQIPFFVEKSELCVCPSHMEAMPLAWLEVLSMGKQLVASAIGPGFEIVKDKETGLLCNPHKPDDIAAKIIWMLENKEKAQKMGMKSRKDILERFDIKSLSQKNIDFYKKIINI